MKRLLLVLFVPLVVGAAWAAEPLSLKGEVRQGALLIGKTLPGARVMHDGQPVMVSEQGDFLIGFERLAETESVLQVQLPDGGQISRPLKVATREYDIQRIDGLPQRKVEPKEEDLERIRDDSRQAKEARALRDDRTDYLSGFEWPSIGRISGVYGSQRILNGKPRWPHYGVDIAAPEGTPVRAPADGLVTLAHPDMFYSGATLILDHGQGLSSSFLHLNKILVKEGQRVRQGDIIARIGASGRVTGPHLDWRMNLLDKRVDPTTLVGPMPADAEKLAGEHKPSQ